MIFDPGSGRVVCDPQSLTEDDSVEVLNEVTMEEVLPASSPWQDAVG